MVIAFLAKRKEIHTVKWVNGLAERGHEVHLITMHEGVEELSGEVILHTLPYSPPLGYFLNVKAVKKILSEVKPDVFNIHYASGYGTLGMLVNYKPSVLSVWGSDVYIFPNKSYFHKKLIQKNLSSVDKVFSTSVTMARHIKDELGYDEDILVTPFGIDLDKFTSINKHKDNKKIVLGTIKKLEDRYGIDILLNVFGKLLQRINDQPMLLDRIEFLIVGGGGKYQSLVKLAKKLGLENKVRFTGHVSHSEVVKYLNKLDIYFALSRVESFGVAVLEASACEVPAIVSDKGGLWEVVKDGETGYIKKIEDIDEIVNVTLRLINDQEKRRAFGTMGRKFVEQRYSWDHCLKTMEKSYNLVIQNYEAKRV